MTDMEGIKEYKNQITLWNGDESLEKVKDKTNQSLESLRQEVELSTAEKEAIKKLPDYTPDATAEEKKAREAYFMKMKSSLTLAMESSPYLNVILKSIKKKIKEIDENGKVTFSEEERNTSQIMSSFEELILYLYNKDLTKVDAVACSAIDIANWMNDSTEWWKYPSSSIGLINIYEDYKDHCMWIDAIKFESNNQKDKKNKDLTAETNKDNEPKSKKEALPWWTSTQSANNQLSQWYREPSKRKYEKLSGNNWFSLHTTKSHPFQRWQKRTTKDWKEKQWTTLCSLTTRLNLEMLGLPNPPRGDALAAMKNPQYFDYWPLAWSILTKDFKPEWEKEWDTYGKKDIAMVRWCEGNNITASVEDTSASCNANFGEMYMSSKSVYGHRAAIFKSKDNGQRYVLDPYVGGAWIEPQPLKTYLNKCESKWKKVYRVNLFNNTTANNKDGWMGYQEEVHYQWQDEKEQKEYTTLTGEWTEKIQDSYNKLQDRIDFKNESHKPIIIINSKENPQKAYIIKNHTITKTYTISTGKNGVGNEWGTGKTPLGTLAVDEKIGDSVSKGTIFKSQKNTWKIATIEKKEIDTSEDLITSRIITLVGKEDKNRNTKERYIYIHGTNEEWLLWRPSSHGCIRMDNDNIIELYDIIKEWSLVEVQ